MAIDEGSRHRLYEKLDQLLGSEEATTLMSLLPPVGWADVATKQDLTILRAGFDALRADFNALRKTNRSEHEALRHEVVAAIERSSRRVIMWTTSMALTTGGLAFIAGRFV
jgi:hypothetical protein